MGGGRGLTTARGSAAAWIGGLIIVSLFFFWSPLPTLADSITGHADVIYSKSTFVDETPAGDKNNTESRGLIQIYSLAADKYLWPNLKLFASGIFQQNATDSITNEEKTSTTTVLTRPYLDLSLRSFPFSGGVTWSKVTTETRTAGSPRIPLINEVYTGYLGWRPSELPSLEIRMVDSKNYDKDRLLINTEDKTVTVTSDYNPVKTVHLRYYGNYADQQDFLKGSDITVVGHDGRVDYGEQFFRNRFSVTASEEYSYATIKTSTTSGQGTFNQLVSAIRGLALNTFDLQGLSRVQLADASFLIDNVLNGPRNDSNNIGSSLYPQDTTPRNIGLQFAVPTQVNTVDVWVYSVHDTRNPDTTQDFLSSAVAAAYTWSVYTSSDNITWSLYLSSVSATYSPFAAQLGVGKFEITFPDVTTQYLKVVVTPLLPSAAGNEGLRFPGVYLTELQALISIPAAKVQGERTAKTQTTNIATKYMILEKPFVSYDFSYFDVESESLFARTRNSTMSNGFSYSQQYNTVFSGNAGALRLDESGSDPNSRRVVYQLSTSVLANPLPTLHHSLAYGYQNTSAHDGNSSSQSVYMTNQADLYKGVGVYLNGGETWAIDINNARSTSVQYAYGITVVPLKTLSITASSIYSRSTSTATSFYSRSDTLSVAYSPFTTLFLNASWNTIDETTRHDRLTNYSVSFAPFPGTDLIFGFAYLETLQMLNNVHEKIIQESLRWNINRRMYAQTIYADTTANSDLQRTLIRTFTAQLSVAL